MRVRLGMVALIVALGSFFWWSTSQAGDDEAACKADCNAQLQQCVQACGAHNNPVECESACRNDAYECTEDCRR